MCSYILPKKIYNTWQKDPPACLYLFVKINRLWPNLRGLHSGCVQQVVADEESLPISNMGLYTHFQNGCLAFSNFGDQSHLTLLDTREGQNIDVGNV